jgi:hypothetical protein
MQRLQPSYLSLTNSLLALQKANRSILERELQMIVVFIWKSFQALRENQSPDSNSSRVSIEEECFSGLFDHGLSLFQTIYSACLICGENAQHLTSVETTVEKLGELITSIVFRAEELSSSSSAANKSYLHASLLSILSDQLVVAMTQHQAMAMTVDSNAPGAIGLLSEKKRLSLANRLMAIDMSLVLKALSLPVNVTSINEKNAPLFFNVDSQKSLMKLLLTVFQQVLVQTQDAAISSGDESLKERLISGFVDMLFAIFVPYLQCYEQLQTRLTSSSSTSTVQNILLNSGRVLTAMVKLIPNEFKGYVANQMTTNPTAVQTLQNTMKLAILAESQTVSHSVGSYSSNGSSGSGVGSSGSSSMKLNMDKYRK